MFVDNVIGDSYLGVVTVVNYCEIYISHGHCIALCAKNL